MEKEIAGHPIERFKSTAMNAGHEVPDCAVCRFLAGGRDIKDMIQVIHVLDNHLAQQEDTINKLVEVIHKMEKESHDQWKKQK